MAKEVPEVSQQLITFVNSHSRNPQSLQDKRVLSIDLSAIMAGSGIRGQFEEKFKALIKDIEDEAGNVICFIDEVREYP